MGCEWRPQTCLVRYPIAREALAEIIGTAVLIIIGDGSVAQVVLGNRGNYEMGNFLSISLGWGMAVTLAVLVSGGLGLGHVNPAVSLSMFALRKINLKRLIALSLAQYFGAFLGAVCLFGVYHEQLVGMQARANATGGFEMAVCGGVFSTMPASSHLTCFFDQILGTGLLLVGILAITDDNNFNIPGALQPLYLGFLVAAIIQTYALNCGGSINPARDLGPRILMLIGGWGPKAFSYDGYYFWVPIVGPYCGALVGSAVYEVCVGMHLKGRKYAEENGVEGISINQVSKM